jgi:hypothetical protein
VTAPMPDTAGHTVFDRFLLRDDFCSCPKFDDEYGKRGWHWKPDPNHPSHPQRDIAQGPCPHYREVMRLRTEAKATLEDLRTQKLGTHDLHLKREAVKQLDLLDKSVRHIWGE